MGVHDTYVKNLLNQAVSQKYITKRSFTIVRFAKGTAQIDGVIKSVKGDIAVEIESRTAKQVRGAIIDLFFHKTKKKLLILVPAYMHDPEKLKRDAIYILKNLKRLRPEIVFKVVILKGTGMDKKPEEDLEIICKAITQLEKSN